MRVPLPTESYFLDATGAADQRLVNVYAEPQPSETGIPFRLVGTPGMTVLASTGSAGPVRGIVQLQNQGFIFESTGTVFEYSNIGVLTGVGTIDATGVGVFSMATDGTNTIFVFNRKAWLHNGATFTDITSTLPFAPGSVTWVSGYFVMTVIEADQFFVSDLNSATSFPPLNFASAEGNPDILLTCLSIHLDLWLFGTKSVEVWYLSGAADFPFQRQSGGFIEYGTASTASPARVDNSIFWLGHDRKVYRANGYAPQCVSTPALERWMQDLFLGDVIGFEVTVAGHNSYVLTFPTANYTWAYDATNDKWYELSSAGSSINRWRANCSCVTNFQMLVGDYLSGAIMVYDNNVTLEVGNGLQRMVIFPALYGGGQPGDGVQFPTDMGGGRRLFMSRLFLDAFPVGQSFLVSWSDDEGQTWKGNRSVVITRLRSYLTRLGSFRRRLIRIQATGAFNLFDVQADMDGGNS